MTFILLCKHTEKSQKKDRGFWKYVCPLAVLVWDRVCCCREGIHLRGEEATTQKGRGKPKDMGKKAVLLCGPPGIGKTSSATIITRSAPHLPGQDSNLPIVSRGPTSSFTHPTKIAGAITYISQRGCDNCELRCYLDRRQDTVSDSNLCALTLQ